MISKRFLNFYGSKWRAAKRYPEPKYSTLIEPFCGGAGYASRYSDRNVILCEKDPTIANVWGYLISVKESEISSLPDIDFFQTLDDFPELCQEARWLIGFWLNSASAQPKKSPSSWMISGIRPNGCWGSSIRQSISSNLKHIRHWRVFHCDYSELPDFGEATWFVDPPYQVTGKHYRFGSKKIDFEKLGNWCRGLKGQVMVCENEGADWLPFEPFHEWTTGHSRYKTKEVIWTNGEGLDA